MLTQMVTFVFIFQEYEKGDLQFCWGKFAYKEYIIQQNKQYYVWCRKYVIVCFCWKGEVEIRIGDKTKFSIDLNYVKKYTKMQSHCP